MYEDATVDNFVEPNHVLLVSVFNSFVTSQG